MKIDTCVVTLEHNELRIMSTGQVRDGVYVPPAEIIISGEENILRLANRLSEHISMSVQDTQTFSSEKDKKLYQILHTMGIPSHIKGFHYIRAAVEIVLMDVSVLSSITKVLYPRIAEQWNTTPGRVERAIRHAINTAWRRIDFEAIQEVFGYRPSMAIPKNAEFIGMVADRLRVE
jgi:hypothetical protein